MMHHDSIEQIAVDVADVILDRGGASFEQIDRELYGVNTNVVAHAIDYLERTEPRLTMNDNGYYYFEWDD